MDRVVPGAPRVPRVAVPILRPVILPLLLVTLAGLIAVGCARPPRISSPAAPTAPAAAVTPVAFAPPAATPAPPAVPSPTGLGVVDSQGRLVTPGTWLVGAATFRFRAPAVTTLTGLVPQVEVVPFAADFKGAPTGAGTATTSEGVALGRVVVDRLDPGVYRWQARFVDPASGRVGPWAGPPGDAAIEVAGTPPSVAWIELSGVSHQRNGVGLAGRDDRPRLSWNVVGDPDLAVDRLALLADHQEAAPASPPSGARSLPAEARALPVADLADGRWYLHLWAVDKLGRTGPPATVALQIDRAAPALADLRYRSWVTNPSYQTVPITFSLAKPASVQLAILPENGSGPLRTYDLGAKPAGQSVQVAWDGRDAKGSVVAPGVYRFTIDLTDDAGNHTEQIYDGLAITAKVIVVSLSSEHLYAYDAGQLFLSTPVTTGGQELATRPGTFEIEDKESPKVFHSPYPRSSPFWFPDSKADHAMLFDPEQANFIHDAPWRSVFGPGTDGWGTPGSTYTGSHGCVDTPTSAMLRLWSWATEGVPVIVEK